MTTLTYGNEKPRDLLLVLCPGVLIALLAALVVSVRTMQDHWSEEESIEPRKGAVKAGDKAPS